MQNKPKYLALVLLVLFSACALAHQPRLVTQESATVLDPEVSKAFYDTLTGQPRVYNIYSKINFNLYLNILVPESNPKARYSAEVYMLDGGKREKIAVLDGNIMTWQKYFEPFGHDTYYKGPELKKRLRAGFYEIEVHGSKNQGRYALAIGEEEKFPYKEVLKALKVIPKLKKDFFQTSPVTFILSPMGMMYLGIILLLAMLIGAIVRVLFKPSMKAGKNCGMIDRVARLIVGLGLLLAALMTNWSASLIFLSGFILFEALAGWCIVYAIIGKSTRKVAGK
jgi:hypothetical protein